LFLLPFLRQYNIFISHAWAYDEQYQRLEEMLLTAPNIKIVNYSAPKDKPIAPPDEPISTLRLKNAITEKIKYAQAFLLISGMWIKYRQWVQYEIGEARRMEKPIICIKPYGSQRVPRDLETYADRIVGWSTASIVQAIRDLAQ
jgi:hypothetical protein